MEEYEKVVDDNFSELLAKYFGVKIVSGECDSLYGKISAMHWDAVNFGRIMALNAVADGIVTPEELRKQREEMKVKEQEQPND